MVVETCQSDAGRHLNDDGRRWSPDNRTGIASVGLGHIVDRGPSHTRPTVIVLNQSALDVVAVGELMTRCFYLVPWPP